MNECFAVARSALSLLFVEKRARLVCVGRTSELLTAVPVFFVDFFCDYWWSFDYF